MNADAITVALSAIAVALFGACLHAADVPHGTKPLGFGYESPVEDFLTIDGAGVLNDPAFDVAWRNLEFQDAGNALLWIDAEGNVGASVHVEQIVYFDRTGKPIGSPLSERCQRSVARSRGATAVLCFADDALAKAVGGPL